MIGKFAAAAREFERALANSSHPKGIKKKLIICYTENSEIDKALTLTSEMIREDMSCLTAANAMESDSHCLELISVMEKHFLVERRLQQCLALAILWLFIDPLQSIRYFEFARTIDSNDDRVSDILALLDKRTTREANQS